MAEQYTPEHLAELVEQKQYRTLKTALREMNEVDIAEFLGELESDQVVRVFRLLPKELAAEVFTYLEDSDDQERLLTALSDKELREFLDELYLDDAVDIIEDMPANLVNRILRNTDASTRSQINQLLNYPKDSAGSLMTTEFVSLHPDATVEESFARIRHCNYCNDNTIKQRMPKICYSHRFREIGKTPVFRQGKNPRNAVRHFRRLLKRDHHRHIKRKYHCGQSNDQ